MKLKMSRLVPALLAAGLLTIGGIAAQSDETGDPLGCIIQNENPVDPQTLPDNMRLIIQSPPNSLVDDELYLVNPKDNTRQLIPDSVGEPLLFDNATRLVLIRAVEYGGEEEIVTTNLDGTNSATVLVDEHSYYVFYDFLTNNRLLYFYEGFWALDLESGERVALEVPEFRDPVLSLSSDDTYFVGYRYDPTAQWVAYWAYQIDENGEHLDDQPRILRIQNVATDEFTDIEPGIPPDEPVGFVWNGSPGYLYVSRLFASDFMIFDVSDGHLIEAVIPPAPFDGLFITEMAESPDRRLMAVYYTDYPLLGRVGIYDLIQHTWLPICFQLRYRMYFDLGNDIMFWTPDGRYIWWLEWVDEWKHLYNLVLVDIETGTYGVIAENVGRRSRIGFLDE